MKVKILIALLGLIVILAALIVFWKPQEIEVTPVPKPLDSNAESVQTAALNGAGTLEELAGREQDLECSISYEPITSTPEVTGSYFVSDAKVRGDFITQSADLGEVVTSYVNDSESIYIWSEINGENYGVVTKVSEQDLIADQKPIPADARVDFQCKEWKQVDNSIFEPPAGILFKEAINADMEYGTVYEEGEFPF